MSEHDFDAGSNVGEDRLPGAESATEGRTIGQEVRGYALGLALAVGLTAASFWVRGTDLVYGPGLALALLVLAVAQMGIHLIFFLHITTAPDNANNILALAVGLTAASFWVRGTTLVYGPGLALALLVLAVAQMGIHLIFFLHITTAPDNENNVLALAFGVLIVCLIVFGSLWVMEHLNHNMVPMQDLMQMQR